MEHQQWLNRRAHGDGVVELELGHAPQNVLSVEFLMDFQHEISAMEADPDVSSIVLTSPFKDFSTGTNQRDWKQDAASSEALERALNTGSLPAPNPSFASPAARFWRPECSLCWRATMPAQHSRCPKYPGGKFTP